MHETHARTKPRATRAPNATGPRTSSRLRPMLRSDDWPKIGPPRGTLDKTKDHGTTHQKKQRPRGSPPFLVEAVRDRSDVHAVALIDEAGRIVAGTGMLTDLKGLAPDRGPRASGQQFARVRRGHRGHGRHGPSHQVAKHALLRGPRHPRRENAGRRARCFEHHRLPGLTHTPDGAREGRARLRPVFLAPCRPVLGLSVAAPGARVRARPRSTP